MCRPSARRGLSLGVCHLTLPHPGAPSRIVFALTMALVLAVSPGSASASDGRFELNHEAALAGTGIGSDAPGYPITLSVPGSYVLTGNLTLPLDRYNALSHVIEITADRVSVDLNGFAISAHNSCTVTEHAQGVYFDSISCATTDYYLGVGIFAHGRLGVRIHNGSVSGMAGSCIDVRWDSGMARHTAGTMIEDVVVSDCGDSGISASRALVRNVQVSEVLGIGIAAQTVSRARVSGAGSYGISAALVRDCRVFSSNVGIKASGVAANNHVTRCKQEGLQCNSCVARDNQINYNLSYGIEETYVGRGSYQGNVLHSNNPDGSWLPQAQVCGMNSLGPNWCHSSPCSSGPCP